MIADLRVTGSPLSAVSIGLLGRDFVEVTESNMTLTFELSVRGLSFGVVPLRVVAVSYDGLEELRESFGIESSLKDIAGSNPLPSVPAMPCEFAQFGCCDCFNVPHVQIWTSMGHCRLWSSLQTWFHSLRFSPFPCTVTEFLKGRGRAFWCCLVLCWRSWILVIRDS